MLTPLKTPHVRCVTFYHLAAFLIILALASIIGSCSRQLVRFMRPSHVSTPESRGMRPGTCNSCSAHSLSWCFCICFIMQAPIWSHSCKPTHMNMDKHRRVVLHITKSSVKRIDPATNATSRVVVYAPFQPLVPNMVYCCPLCPFLLSRHIVNRHVLIHAHVEPSMLQSFAQFRLVANFCVASDLWRNIWDQTSTFLQHT